MTFPFGRPRTPPPAHTSIRRLTFEALESRRLLAHAAVDDCTACAGRLQPSVETTTQVGHDQPALGEEVANGVGDPLSLAGFVDEAVVSEGVSQPISLAFFPDGRMLILEKVGRILIADPNTGATSVYMELTNINSGQERGLLDITLAPDFDPSAPGDDHFYLFYTPSSPQRAKIARFTHQENSGGLTSAGDLSSEFEVWRDTDGYIACCHYGGGLDFGPDGKLWLTSADKFTGPAAGEGGPDLNLPQDLTSAGGKIIRVNPDGSVPDGTDGWPANPYLSADDDPFVPGAQDYNDYIWAYGLRNPFRARWDLPSGQLFIGEVGGNQHTISTEDIHTATLSSAGANYGWPYYEGVEKVEVLDPDGQFAPTHGFGSAPEDTVAPLYSYPHDAPSSGNLSASLTGGEVYRGGQFPSEWQGVYFYGDFTDDFLRYVRFDEFGEPTGDFPFKPSAEIPGAVNQVIFIGVGVDGALYYTLLEGQVRRITHTSANQPPEVTAPAASPETGPTPLNVTFTATATDPEGDPLTYEWFFGDGSSSGPQPVPASGQIQFAHQYTADGLYSAYLEVSDATHSVVTNLVTVQSGVPNMAPTIDQLAATPTSGEAPLEVTLTAEVSDPENDPLTYRWQYGDGVTSVAQPVPANGQIVSNYTYAADGVYTPVLVISDGEFETDAQAPIVAIGTFTLPPITDGMVLLLESDIKVSVLTGTTVTAWLDGSGWGNNLFAGGDPQLTPNATPGGLPAIVFDGDGDKLERLASETINQFPDGAEDRTLFSVANYVDNNQIFAGAAYGNGSPNEAFGAVTNRHGFLTVQGWGGGNDNISTAPGQGEGWLVQSIVLSDDNFTHYQDGAQIDAGVHSYATNLGAATSKIVLGEEISGLGNSEMALGAVVLYDRALSPSEREQVEQYLHNKYLLGLTPPLTSGDQGYTAIGGSAIVDVLANDTTSAGQLDPASVQIAEPPSQGNVSVDPATGKVTYTHTGAGYGSDTFSYTVQNTNGMMSTPTDVVVTIGSGLLLTDSLVLQLESDTQVTLGAGQVVTGWLDASGNGNDIATSIGDPTLTPDSTPSGKPAVAFDGDDSLERNAPGDPLNQLPSGDADRTVYLVASYDATTAFSGFSYGDGAPNQAFGLTIDGQNGNLTVQGWGGGNDFVSAEAAEGAGWLVQSAVLSDNQLSHFRDGQIIDQAEHTFATATAEASSRLALGGEISGLGFAQMDIAAVLVYDRALTAGEQQLVEAALRTKYLLAPAIPGDYDRSGVVDQDDYAYWRSSFGAATDAALQADGNGDGAVDAADYTVWRDNLGAVAPAPQQAPVATQAADAGPEPSPAPARVYQAEPRPASPRRPLKATPSRDTPTELDARDQALQLLLAANPRPTRPPTELPASTTEPAPPLEAPAPRANDAAFASRLRLRLGWSE